MTAKWLDLAMLNYEVSPDLILPLVPAGTELDEWHGKTYVSVVGFRFMSTRVLGIAVPWHRDFEEVNLRFYVRRLAADGWRRGVVFIRELVPRRAIAWVARALYNEPYRVVQMRHTIERDRGGSIMDARYEWKHRGRWEGLALRSDDACAPLAPGSEEEFITEHYWGYTRQRDGSTIEYQVEHPSWRVATAHSAELHTDVASLYGAQFESALNRSPDSAFLAEGSHVVVHRPNSLPKL